MKIIVCGSRDWPQEQSWRITNTLWSLYQAVIGLNHDRFYVAHGACPTGADAIADAWVEHAAKIATPDLPIWPLRYPANWDQFGKAAGPIRNRQMAQDGADLVLAFIYEPDGRASGGTRSMILAANEANIPVWSVTIP